MTASARPDPYASDEDWEAAGFPVPGAGSDYRVAEVKVVGPWTLWVKHSDGVEGQVRFEESALTGIFGPLKSPAAFQQAHVQHGAVTWPDGIDIAPDNMHRHLAAFGEWVLR